MSKTIKTLNCKEYHNDKLFKISISATNFAQVYYVYADCDCNALDYLEGNGYIDLHNSNPLDNDIINSIEQISE